MIDIQHTYLQLLRQAIYSVDDAQCANRPPSDEGIKTADADGIKIVHTPYSISEQSEWSILSNPLYLDSLLRLAQIQGTAPLVYDQLLKADSLLPNEVLQQLKQACMQNMIHQQRLVAVLRQVFTALSQDGVQATLLKGFGLARLYPLPYLRTWGDLDVFVGVEQYHQAAEILRKTYPDAKHHDEEWEELKHYNFVLSDGNVIELHRNSIKFMLPREMRLWEQIERQGCIIDRQLADIEGTVLPIPEVKFNLLFTFIHAWNHFVESGVGMKQLCDVALLAHYTFVTCTPKDVCQYLRKYLRHLHLYEPWQLMGYVCVTALGLPKSEWPLYEEGGRHLQTLRERFFIRVMREGCTRPSEYTCLADKIAQREKAKHMNIIVRKWQTLKSRFRVVQFIYPYSPRYALNLLYGLLYRGIRRTLRGEKMIDY